MEHKARMMSVKSVRHRMLDMLPAPATVIFGWLYVTSAVACNGSPPPSVEGALKGATLVIVAELISTEQHPVSGDTTARVITEHATFRILEVFKGPHRKGEIIHIVSEIGPGPCGMSAKNNPVAIESVGKDNKTYAPVLSGKWLIYGYGPEPHDLDMMTRTKPMEFGGEAEVGELRRLVGRGTRQRKTG
jgi:hypothetical protein